MSFRRTPYWSVSRLALQATSGLLLLGLTSACISQVSNDPVYWLRRSLIADRAVDLTASEMISISNEGDPGRLIMRKVMQTRDGRSQVSWQSQSGQAGITVYDDGVWTQKFDPKANELSIARSTARPRDTATLQRVLRQILRNYRPSLRPDMDVAGRHCRTIELCAREPHNRCVTLWIDSATGVVLGHSIHLDNGTTIRVHMYTAVKFTAPKLPAQTAPPFSSRRTVVNYSRSPILHNLAELSRTVGFDVVIPTWMPRGYEFDRAEVVQMNGIPTACLRYTDGLAEITVLESQTVKPRLASFRSNVKDHDNMGTNLLDLRDGQMNYLVVGRMDHIGLNIVANALNRAQEKQILDYLAATYKVSVRALRSLRNEGLGLDTLQAFLDIARQRNRSILSLLSYYRQGIGWESIANQLKVDVNSLQRKVSLFQAN